MIFSRSHPEALLDYSSFVRPNQERNRPALAWTTEMPETFPPVFTDAGVQAAKQRFRCTPAPDLTSTHLLLPQTVWVTRYPRDPCCPAQPPPRAFRATNSWKIWCGRSETAPLLVESVGSETPQVVASFPGQIGMRVCTCEICHRPAYACVHRG